MSAGWRFAPRARDHGPDRPASAGRESCEPDWKAARPAAIARALARALAQPTGGWYALDASRRIGARPRAFVVDGVHVVAWRDARGLVVAPEECPHMGASLEAARVQGGCVVCPWHGLRLGRGGHGTWQPLRAHDDGVLAWVQLAQTDEPPTEQPILAPRPERFVDGVVHLTAACMPADVIANRLDPWHGATLHPYSFGALEVLEERNGVLLVRVEKRIAGPLRVAVDATFTCPDARTIVMTIVAGEGRGSVVETHATPLGNGRTAIVEATLASSERLGFRFARRLAPLVRPLIERSARRLWVDDAAYAERRRELRARGWRA